MRTYLPSWLCHSVLCSCSHVDQRIVIVFLLWDDSSSNVARWSCRAVTRTLDKSCCESSLILIPLRWQYVGRQGLWQTIFLVLLFLVLFLRCLIQRPTRQCWKMILCTSLFTPQNCMTRLWKGPDPPFLLSDTYISPPTLSNCTTWKNKNILQHAPWSLSFSFYMDVKMHHLENTGQWLRLYEALMFVPGFLMSS